MTPQLIESLVRQSEARTTIGEVEYESYGAKLVLKFKRSCSVSRAGVEGGQVPGSAHDASRPDAAPTRRVLRAPATGILRCTHPLAELPQVAPGSSFLEGQQIAFLQVGGVLCSAEADAQGVLGEMLVFDGSLVGFGDALFELR